MNEKVANAISSLEQEVLKTLLGGPLQPINIASILGTEVISKRPDGKSTGIANPIITGILWGLERRKLVKQPNAYAPWEITDLGKKHIQQNDSGIHFDEITARGFFPGAFEIIDSAFALLEPRAKSVAEKQKANTMIPINDHRSLLGILSSSLILLGHTTELLLKFKLQLDGREIQPIHNLHRLFNGLSEDSKHLIEAVYKHLKDQKRPSDTKWTTVDTLFKSHPKYHVDWRYVVQTNTGKLNALYCHRKLGPPPKARL